MRLPVFLFGTLLYPPLLRALVPDAAELTMTHASLPDHAVLSVREGAFPTIRATPGATANGVLVHGLGETARETLDFFESIFDYDLRQIVTADGQRAEAYFPPETGLTPGAPWSFEDWVNDWGEIYEIGARELLVHRGHKTASELRAMTPMIWARAASRLRASESKHSADTFDGDIDVGRRSATYARFFALDEYQLRHTRFDGGTSPVLDRAVFRSTDAAIVLPYDPHRDMVLLVEQFRMGPFARGDRRSWQLEPIAGLIDAGETAVEAARREAKEEAGLTMGALHPVAEVYASPGATTEFYYIYVGLADLPPQSTGTSGLAEENEDIRSRLMSFEDLIALCDAQKVANTPLATAAYWLARHRGRLRSEAGAAMS